MGILRVGEKTKELESVWVPVRTGADACGRLAGPPALMLREAHFSGLSGDLPPDCHVLWLVHQENVDMQKSKVLTRLCTSVLLGSSG